MTETGFRSTIAHLHPSSQSAGPTVAQLKAFRRRALREGRQEDAEEYERMARLFTDRTQEQQKQVPLGIKAAFASVLALVLVLAIHYLM
jgi:hypothetical protein